MKGLLNSTQMPGVSPEPVCVLDTWLYCRLLSAMHFHPAYIQAGKGAGRAAAGRAMPVGVLRRGNLPDPRWLLPSRVEVPPHPEMECCDLLTEKKSFQAPNLCPEVLEVLVVIQCASGRLCCVQVKSQAWTRS